MTETKINTEADALRDVLAWSIERPAWQRDALRRLVAQGELADGDLAELTALCKDKTLAVQPLAEGDINAQQTGAPAVALKSIRGVQNVNALAEGQTLTFLPTGVTIVYGDNGAGKSGYVRILKRACRARTTRGKEETLLPNIYERQTGPQRADLEYCAGSQVQKAEWKNGEATDALLSEISVFDSRTANVHVEETNDLAYTPYPMKLLERLVNACKAVKQKLDEEIATIKAQTPKSISDPSCSASTATGALMEALSKNTKDEALDALATLTDEEIARFGELTSDFANDPKVTARRLRAQRHRLETLRSGLQTLALAIAPVNGARLAALTSDLATKKAAAVLAAQDLSKDEPLAGVGSETWRALWEAARAYSVAEAYPEKAFPHTDEAAHCVLCQQPLGENAAARLTRFETFVQDRTQQEAGSARQTLKDFREGLKGKAVPRVDFIEERQFLDDELGNTALAAAVRDFTVRAHWRLRAMLKANADVDIPAPSLAKCGLDTVIDALETRAGALLADDESEERKKLRSELDELKDRQWLSGIKDDVLAEIERLKSIAKLENALKDTRPNTITAKNTSLSEALITERLRARFAREIDHLNLAGLAIELTQAGSQHGVSRFKLSLIQSASRNAGDILSEGEYRCVALAGFMAELATNNSGSGIIFDDPVSSLDHLHREAIAGRLAEEGRTRQVIVFTHDLPFLFLLRNACTQVDDATQKTEIALRHVQKRQNRPGHCRNEAPDKAQSAAARLKTMRTHLANTRIQHDQDPDGTNWLIIARGLIDSLRQTWETAVEDAISPVLRTFASKVDTKGFAKLSAITQEDADTMRKHYGQCSVLLHKTSDAMSPSAPTPERIEEELDALETWLAGVTDRQSKIKP
ncbi:AAA family ATPase [Aurantimonas marianensis]|uniref:AAA family ATPase n=1 Tax=Aurantimonas marianensis TaxID=2920428 RepID=A0A9X2H7Z1_9HYPH|nr:AAA family ATPase [Aurantimonas marianensis]MCP3054948.1 AAA family ATPase [Aurantimonas marianensis]